VSARYDFSAELWRHTGTAAWHFVTLPKDVSMRIRKLTGGSLNFGSLRVTARIGKTSWRTSVFYDTKAGSFLLPVKAEVRRKEGVSSGDRMKVGVELEL
jgi:hypothetical protein